MMSVMQTIVEIVTIITMHVEVMISVMQTINTIVFIIAIININFTTIIIVM